MTHKYEFLNILRMMNECVRRCGAHKILFLFYSYYTFYIFFLGRSFVIHNNNNNKIIDTATYGVWSYGRMDRRYGCGVNGGSHARLDKNARCFWNFFLKKNTHICCPLLLLVGWCVRFLSTPFFFASLYL